MAIVERTVLVVAAEGLEFDGIRKQLGSGTAIAWPGAAFAHEVTRGSVCYWLVANGPGPRLVKEALAEKKRVQLMVSTGFCGALDPELRVGDIIVTSNLPQASLPFKHGTIHSADRVVVTKEEKRELRNSTGASAVDMEAATVEQKAREWGIPYLCIRVVSDSASDDMPLDFNQYRDRDGRFSRSRIARAALSQPFTSIPALLRLNKSCRHASEKLGVFFANCRF